MGQVVFPGDGRRVVVDRTFSLGGGKQLHQRGNSFFFLTGEPLTDMNIAESLPEPHRKVAVAFVEEQLKPPQQDEESEVVDGDT